MGRRDDRITDFPPWEAGMAQGDGCQLAHGGDWGDFLREYSSQESQSKKDRIPVILEVIALLLDLAP